MNQNVPIPDAEAISFEGFLGTSPATLSNRNGLAVVRTSGTVLTVGSGAAAATPQNIHMGSRGKWGPSSFAVTGAGTVTIGASTLAPYPSELWVHVYAYLDENRAGHVVVIAPRGLTLTAGGANPPEVLNVGHGKVDQIVQTGLFLYAHRLDRSGGVTFEDGGGRDQSKGGDVYAGNIALSVVDSNPVVTTLVDGQGNGYLSGASLPVTSLTRDVSPYVVQATQFRDGLVGSAGTASAVRFKLSGWMHPHQYTAPTPHGVSTS